MIAVGTTRQLNVVQTLERSKRISKCFRPYWLGAWVFKRTRSATHNFWARITVCVRVVEGGSRLLIGHGPRLLPVGPIEAAASGRQDDTTQDKHTW